MFTLQQAVQPEQWRGELPSALYSTAASCSPPGILAGFDPVPVRSAQHTRTARGSEGQAVGRRSAPSSLHPW